MFEHAFLEQQSNGHLAFEETLLKEELDRLGVPITLYTAKRIQRRQLPLTRHTFLCGDMDATHGALKQLGIDPPAPDDYPSCLAPYLHRRIWTSALGDLEQAFEMGRADPVFIKPAHRRKSFTGRVFDCPEDFQALGRLSRRERVYCSEVVDWESEHRVYVIQGTVRIICHYSGEPALHPDPATVQAAVEVYEASGTAPRAYGIDFGILATGQTALVEANDGFSLGAYPPITASDYASLLLTRWAELMQVPSAREPGSVRGPA